MSCLRCSILLPDDLRQDALARGGHSTEKGTSTLMTALTRTEARELSRRFAEVGVDVSPGGSNKSVATAR